MSFSFSIRAIGCLAVMLVSLHAAGDRFVLVGRLVDSNGKAFRNVISTVSIRSVSGLFSKSKLIGRGGEFKFGELDKGSYVVSATVPGYGDVRKTVIIGPSFADEKGKIEVTIRLDENNRIPASPTVSAQQLNIPWKAQRELDRARGRLEERDAAGAIDHLEKALAIAPAFSAAWNLLGTIQFQTKNYLEAEKDFRQALEYDPPFYAALINLGAAVLALGKLEEAVELNRKAVGVRPNDPLAHGQLGQSYLAVGDLETAEKHLQNAKNLDPSHFSMPQVFLAEIYRRLGKKEAQVAEIEEFIQYQPDSEMSVILQEVLEELRSQR